MVIATDPKREMKVLIMLSTIMIYIFFITLSALEVPSLDFHIPLTRPTHISVHTCYD